MAVKIRLARGGAKKVPYYKMVIADARAPRDGDFIEKVGTYNPLLKKDDEARVALKKDRIEYWLGQGAQPTERVAKFIQAADIKLPSAIANKIATKVKGQVKKPSKKELKNSAN
jgi:small subunit ribosomal protein S16